MNYIKSYLTLILLCLVTVVYAQKRITGHVWSKSEGAIMMANVVEVDANNRIVSATTTDVNGNFSLQIKNNKNNLRISYIGYRMRILPIGEQSSFRVEMQDQSLMPEATVHGRRRNTSGKLSIPEKQVSTAVQSLNMDELEGLSFETASDALQGQIAGLDIVSNSGNLGSGSSMRLRGVTSISGSQEPLIVVNGNIMEDYSADQLDVTNLENQEQFANLLQVSPDDIKRIEVLKDASATALYGSRGANGVILIETRRGMKGKTKVSFNYRVNGAWQPKGMNMLTGDEYTMMMKEGYFNPTQSSLAASIVELSYRRDRTAYYANYNNNTNWKDEVTQFGLRQNYGVSLTGGGEKATFRFSVSYDNDKGTVIEQKLNRFSTRLALDYYVSDRMTFSSNFAMVFVNNKKNYSDIIAKAYNAMPNMAINRWEYNAHTGEYYDTGEYFRMFPSYGSAGEVPDGYTSYYLRDMVNNGNPVAIARNSWLKESTSTITPEFIVKYELLGKNRDESMLTYEGKVFINSYTNSNHTYFPAELTSSQWQNGVNLASNYDFKVSRFETTHSLTYIPAFENKDHTFQTRIEGQISTSSSTTQTNAASGLAGGISDPTVIAYQTGTSTGTGRSRYMYGTMMAQYAYKDRYSLFATVRADGSTKFGKGNKWGFFPGISGRWNISEEAFFEPLKEKAISMFGVRVGWGSNGNQVGSEGTMYNSYQSLTNYMGMDAIAPSGLRLVNIRWEKTQSWNVGFNLNFFQDLLQFDFNVYDKRTSDLIMSGVQIPSSTGFNSLSYANVGKMKNQGWELNFNSREIIKAGKFKLFTRFNLAQNINQILDMESSVLKSKNSTFNATSPNENWLYRVQIGNALGGIYGFRYKGIYRYDYDHSGYFGKEELNTRYGGYTKDYGSPTAAIAASRGENATTPIVRDAQGNIVYDVNGNPLPMYFSYGEVNYTFSGGDVIYEDINHDGQINALDVVYLGSSNPTLNGGFGFTMEYGRWRLTSNFVFRVGNKIINQARLTSENMRTNRNQSAAVNWRWRKNGDITAVPRAMNANAGASYNALPSDRYVEKGDFLRLRYVQLSYSFPAEQIKSWGLTGLRLSLSGDNLFFWTKYSGVDPEHSTSGYYPAIDRSQTPNSRSFTFSLTADF